MLRVFGRPVSLACHLADTYTGDPRAGRSVTRLLAVFLGQHTGVVMCRMVVLSWDEVKKPPTYLVPPGFAQRWMRCQALFVLCVVGQLSLYAVL